MKNGDLVSIIVVTYNSSQTVVETLESIKNQTYKNLELVITDDCSEDNTVFLCEEWLHKNENRFYRTRLITSEKNTGICANANRGWRATRGEWIKDIAGDDIMLPNCITDYVEFVVSHPGASLVTAYYRVYNETFEEKNCLKIKAAYRDISIFDKDATTQARLMAHDVFIYGPTVFRNRKMVETVGGYDEHYAFEDLPFFLTAMEMGYKCYFLNKETTCYRIHESVGHSTGRLFNPKFLPGYRQILKERAFVYFNATEKVGELLIWAIQDILILLNMNKDTKTIKSIYNKLYNLIHRIFKNDGRDILKKTKF